MKVLVVGSLGFIGGHIVEALSREHEVWECDVVPGVARPTYHCLDPTGPDFLGLFQGQKFDLCVNCSGAAHVQNSFDDPALDFRLNVANVLAMLDAIRKSSPDTKFLNMSSAAVYGNPTRLPISEHETAKPMSPYGFHKKMAEDLCFEFSESFGLATLNLRVFSAYGTGLRKQIVWDLFRKYQDPGDSLELFGTGNETRDFIHVDDLAQLVGRIADQFPTGAGVVNAASGVQVRIADLAHLVGQVLGSRKPVVFNGRLRPGDPTNWEADIALARTFGFRPSVDIETGVAQYSAWLKT